jgi:four helix bundle protein
MTTHKELKVWQVGIALVKEVYQFADLLPKSEEFGLKSQLRRAAVSIPTNIAEGAARNHLKEYIQFAYIALGSLAEIETLLTISNSIYKLDISMVEDKSTEARKLLLGYIKYLKTKTN